jgi:hypothetical protein
MLSWLRAQRWMAPLPASKSSLPTWDPPFIFPSPGHWAQAVPPKAPEFEFSAPQGSALPSGSPLPQLPRSQRAPQSACSSLCLLFLRLAWSSLENSWDCEVLGLPSASSVCSSSAAARELGSCLVPLQQRTSSASLYKT